MDGSQSLIITSDYVFSVLLLKLSFCPTHHMGSPITSPASVSSPNLFVTTLTPTGDDDGEEFWLDLLTVILAAPDCCSPALSTCWFIKQLLFCTHSSTIWPHWSLWCLAGSCGDTQLPWGGHELCFTYPPSSTTDQTTSSVPLRLPPPPHCLHVRLWVHNMMESDFGRSDACFLLSPQNRTGNWATEEESRCLLWGATQRGAHNGFHRSSSRSV